MESNLIDDARQKLAESMASSLDGLIRRAISRRLDRDDWTAEDLLTNHSLSRETFTSQPDEEWWMMDDKPLAVIKRDASFKQSSDPNKVYYSIQYTEFDNEGNQIKA